jgi:hypothetical protein
LGIHSGFLVLFIDIEIYLMYYQVILWDYGSWKLLHSIDTGHSMNIFCTKFMPETGDDVVVSGAGDAEVV